jgi:predicted regulator of Ras-like GTPase activity (Roadblock/LC7/MglB family)
MFKLDDQAMDKIFNNLGVNDAAAPVNAAGAAPVAPPVAPIAPNAPVPPPVPPVGGRAVPPPVPAPQGQQGWAAPQASAPPRPGAPAPAAPMPAAPAAKAGANGLFNVDDATMDRIFNDLGVKEKPAAVPKINVREAVNQIRTLAEIPAPKVEGVSRLSREPEQQVEATPGKINAIGKFLLDQQDLQKLGNLTTADLSDGKVRVLTHEASDEINKLLEHIAQQPNVVGSVIVGHDGILIANSLPKEHDPETIGILSLGIYVNTTNIAKKMGHNHLHQLVSRTPHGYLVIADFGGGILVCVSNGQDTDKLIPLMRSITQLVAQS